MRFFAAPLVTAVSFLCSLLLVAAAPAATTYPTSCKYPSITEITTIFDYLTHGNDTAFFGYVAENVTWVVEGTSPLAGTFTSKYLYYVDNIIRLVAITSPSSPHSINLVNVIGGCDEATSVQEFHLEGTLNSGTRFVENYAWVTKWTKNGTIVEVHEYSDTYLVTISLEANEAPTFSYQKHRFDVTPGPVGINAIGPLPGNLD